MTVYRDNTRTQCIVFNGLRDTGTNQSQTNHTDLFTQWGLFWFLLGVVHNAKLFLYARRRGMVGVMITNESIYNLRRVVIEDIA